MTKRIETIAQQINRAALGLIERPWPRIQVLTDQRGLIHLVPRMRKHQIIHHWIFVAAFFTLLFTGLILFVPWLSYLAVGGWSRVLHRVAAAELTLTPLYYFVADREGLKQLLRDSFTYNKEDLVWLIKIVPYFLGRAHNLPPMGRLNAGEKLHHASTILLYIAIVITGYALWFGQPYLPHDLYLITVMLHGLIMLGLTLLTFGHMYFVFVYSALGSMVSGEIDEVYALTEHSKWLTEQRAHGRVKALPVEEYERRCTFWKRVLGVCW